MSSLGAYIRIHTYICHDLPSVMSSSGANEKSATLSWGSMLMSTGVSVDNICAITLTGCVCVCALCVRVWVCECSFACVCMCECVCDPTIKRIVVCVFWSRQRSHVGKLRVCVFVCVCARKRERQSKYICVFVCMWWQHQFRHLDKLCVCVCTSMCGNVCTHLFVTYIHIHTYICMYMHIHTYIHI